VQAPLRRCKTLYASPGRLTTMPQNRRSLQSKKIMCSYQRKPLHIQIMLESFDRAWFWL